MGTVRLTLEPDTRDLAAIRTRKSHKQIVAEIFTLVDPPISQASWDRVESEGVSPATMRRILEAFELYARNKGEEPAVIDAHVRSLSRSLSDDHVEATQPTKETLHQRGNMIPFRRNPYFSGRHEQLQHLHFLITCSNVPITAVSGLGGIGKTQFVTEYAYSYESHFKQVLWSLADNTANLKTGFRHIAEFLELPISRAFQNDSVEATRRWLLSNEDWLLILDNADTPSDIESLIPHNTKGHILLTSRDQHFECLGTTERLDLRNFSNEECLTFVSRRLRRQYFDEGECEAIFELNRELGGLPLALEQAVSYIVSRRIPKIAHYVEEFRAQRLDLLKRIGPQVGNYSDSVATTWLLNFKQVRESSKPAADLLKFTSFLADSSPIPYSYIVNALPTLPQSLRSLIDEYRVKSLGVAEALAPLARFSLVNIDPERQTYSIHLVVQELVRNIHDF